VSRIELFERLARAAGAGMAVVTPTRRLARSLSSEYDLWRMARGDRVWETPVVVPFATFTALLYDRAQHDPALSGVRAPLAAAQESVQWQAVVNASNIALARPAAAASLAAEAWLLAHQWRIAERLPRYDGSGDARVFAQWARDYQRRVDGSGAVDSARLPDAVEALVGSGQLAGFADLVLVGFEELNPQQAALVASLAATGARVEHWATERQRGRVVRAAMADARSEVDRMADWVAARLAANPRARIGVVVPDLGARRASIVRALDAVLEPAALLAAPDRLRGYTVSLAGSLASEPLVATALRLLQLASDDLPFDEASALLRARHVDFGAAALRDRFDAELRRRVGRRVSLAQLLVAAPIEDFAADTPRAALQSLERWRAAQGRGRHRHAEWAARTGAALASAGFPGRSALDSAEYQTLARWRELMVEFAALDRVLDPVDLAGAVSRLRELAQATAFQPEGGDPPVQVLGLLEAAGLEFDHVWLMGLTTESWPPLVRPHPLLPLELQRAARMPGALLERELARARSKLDALTCAATEVVASHAVREDDRVLVASPMIAHWPEWTPPPRAARAIDAIGALTLERAIDARAPGLSPSAVLVGGASVLKNQAACPFRAFATHRLNARALDDPHDGFDASERGQLIHQVLAEFWQALPERSRAALAALGEPQRVALLQHAAGAAVARARRRRVGAADDQFVALESRRLVAITSRWLRHEAASRADFEVIATEERRALAVGPLALHGRLDRVDRLADGGTVVIDYKTGKNVSTSGWRLPRPDEPQLPLYLVSAQADARAVALARVNAGEPRFVVWADDDALLPGTSNGWRADFADWTSLVAAWRDELVRLAEAFAAGRAEVEPKRGLQTCRTCDLAALCRINERADAGAPLHAEEAADE
jgi:probable DNA repair protein